MPGYARGTTSSKTFMLSNGTEIYSNKFYGFKYNISTGLLTIDEVDNKSQVITLPDLEGDYESEYIYWIWSGTQLKFEWDEGAESNRLLLEVV